MASSDPSGLDHALAATRAFISSGDLDSARRWIGRARRLAPTSAAVLELQGRVDLRLGDAESALEAFELAARTGLTPDLEAFTVDCLFDLERTRDAWTRLEAALATFALNPNDPLASTARRRGALEDGPWVGWIGRNAAMGVWGEVATERGNGLLAALRQNPDWSVDTERGPVTRFVGQPLECATTVAPWAKGALFGADAPIQPGFRLDGRCHFESDVLEGWARLGWAPYTRPQLTLGRPDGPPLPYEESAGLDPRERHCFRLDLAGVHEPLERFPVFAHLPDGATYELPTSPAIRSLPRAPSGHRRTWRDRTPWRRRTSSKIDVIVPVYAGFDETMACLRSLRINRDPDLEIVVVDDAAPEPALSAALRSLADEGQITLLTNAKNLGFPASVNRGLQLHPDRDVVVLNSDTEVFAGWLQRLRRAAYSGGRVGTATPLTNSGSIASYPRGPGSHCSSQAAAEFDRLATRVNLGVQVDAPTGVGFCLYIRQACRRDTGEFDADLFARGYGEENDFCLRAHAHGWSHVIAADVFVRHLEGRSFAASRLGWMERNARLLDRRHPSYTTRVRDFEARDPLARARRNLDEARLASSSRDRVLLVSLEGAGGVERFVRERCAELTREGVDPLLLRPTADGKVRLTAPDASLNDLVYDPALPDDRARLCALGTGAVELHHFLGHDPSLIDHVISAATQLVVFIHDASWICPRLTLLGGDGLYCGEPDIAGCNRCVVQNGSCLEERLSTDDLRQRSLAWLKRADAIFAPSNDAAARLQRYFPQLTPRVAPWETDEIAPTKSTSTRDVRLKVALIGAIGRQKGSEVLLACARDALARDLPLDFVVLGYCEDDAPAMALPNVFVTGRYTEDEIGGMIAAEAPDVALFASVTPETWCFSLTHALRARLPVVALDLGAIAERVRAAPIRAELVPLGAGAAIVNEALMALGRGDQAPAPASPFSLASAAGPFPASENPSNLLIERSTRPEPHSLAESDMPEAAIGLAATVQLVTLNKGLYGFSVRGGTPTRLDQSDDLVLPAIQVAAAPGVPGVNLEFMTGLRGDGGWLFEPSDVLVVKVKVSGSAVLVTSYTASGLSTLSIEVERLDGPGRRVVAPQASQEARLTAPAAPLLAPNPPPPALLSGGAPRRLADGRRALRLQIVAHISTRGDVSFTDEEWAGIMGERLQIESFAVTPLEDIQAHDLEYKAVTEKGVETPWTPGGQICGTRQLNLALSGFAVRLKGEAARRFECECRGSFRSGAIVGPVKNGAPVRPSSLDDVLQAIQIHVVEASAALDMPPPRRIDAGERPAGPRFSIFRETPK